jgi:hypothetical protein
MKKLMLVLCALCLLCGCAADASGKEQEESASVKVAELTVCRGETYKEAIKNRADRTELKEAEKLTIHLNDLRIEDSDLKELASFGEKTWVFEVNGTKYVFESTAISGKLNEKNERTRSLRQMAEDGGLDRSHFLAPVYLGRIEEENETGSSVKVIDGPLIRPGTILNIPAECIPSSYDKGDYLYLDVEWRPEMTDQGTFDAYAYNVMENPQTCGNIDTSFMGMSEEEIELYFRLKRVRFASGAQELIIPDTIDVLGDYSDLDLRYGEADSITLKWRGESFTIDRSSNPSFFKKMHGPIWLPYLFEQKAFVEGVDIESNVALVTKASADSWEGEATVEKGFHNHSAVKVDLPLPEGCAQGSYVEVFYRYENEDFVFLKCVPASMPEALGAAKPVIYLYPEKETDVDVELAFDGELTVTYPQYEEGWEVTAFPDGHLIDRRDGKEYSYLYWEGEGHYEIDWSKGYCVAGEDSAAFLQDILSEMGMLPEEYNEMIVYWLPMLLESSYNLITFQEESYSDHAKLKISPQPESVLRVFMVFKGLKKPVTIDPPEIIPFERKGFTVVEWGGYRF